MTKIIETIKKESGNNTFDFIAYNLKPESPLFSSLISFIDSEIATIASGNNSLVDTLSYEEREAVIESADLLSTSTVAEVGQFSIVMPRPLELHVNDLIRETLNSFDFHPIEFMSDIETIVKYKRLIKTNSDIPNIVSNGAPSFIEEDDGSITVIVLDTNKV